MRSVDPVAFGPYAGESGALRPSAIQMSLAGIAQDCPSSATRQACMVNGLLWLLHLYDEELHVHSREVATLAVRIGQVMHLRAREVRNLRQAALLHDVGKMALPRHLWRKECAFSAAEKRIARRHPGLGAQMLGMLRTARAAIPGVRHHHERFDGSGYPHGLSSVEIPLAARIVAVADSYEAMTAGRPYQTAQTVTAAREEIRRCSGRQYDPDVVAAFLSLPPESLVVRANRAC